MTGKNPSLNKRLRMLLAVCLVPLSLIIVYLVVELHQLSQRYDRTVQNITKANLYNLTLKETVDYGMYIIVVNSERAGELLVDSHPDTVIEQAKNDFQQLGETELNDSSRICIRMILKTLNSLEKCVTEIEEDASTVGMYDKNLERLDLNIYILTELIQEQIQKYISAEAEWLETMREVIHNDILRTISIGLVLLGFCILAAMFSGKKIMNSITKGVRQVLDTSRKAGKGDFTARVSMENLDEELMELGSGINQMVLRIGNLVEDVKAEQTNLRMMEQKLLQAQINPHFLYNTLDTIIWLAEADQKEEVIGMVSALSDFFRTSLSNGQDQITVEEEETHIHSYLQIQRSRYQDILEYEIDIPEEMHSYQIIKLLLQPVVENALYHGIKNKRGKGCIRIKGMLQGDTMCFTVTDNGIGMLPKRLEQVRNEMKQEDQNSDVTAFGLCNVQQRIWLNYGQDYGLQIESTYGEGSMVAIFLPAIKNHTKI